MDTSVRPINGDNVSHLYIENEIFGNADEDVTGQQMLPGLISDDTVRIFRLVNQVILCTFLCSFGICTNIINIAVFIRQGFKDTVNITLCALSLSDLMGLLAQLWMAICNGVPFTKIQTPILFREILYVTGGWLALIFSMTSGWLTAFLTIERCISVLFPLKVKSIVTRTRIKVVIVFMFTMNMAIVAPVYTSYEMKWKFIPRLNKTMIGVIYDLSLRHIIVVVYQFAMIMPLIYSSLVITSTVILSWSLIKQTKWRLKMASSSSLSTDSEKGKAKDLNVVKMVTIIAIIFIVCLLIPTLINIPMAYVPELRVIGRYANLLDVMLGVCSVLTSINATINIFVYYSMSSRYKQTFRDMFLIKGHRGKDKESIN